MTNKVRKVIFSTVIAALYAALTFVFMQLSFGGLQFRISEMLAILPFFFPVAVPGLFIGCIIANILSPYGFADMLIGSISTLIAAIITMRLGKLKNSDTAAIKSLACIPPVIINAIFIGALIASWMVSEGEHVTFWAAFAINAVQIAFGQAVVLYLLGLPLLIYLPKMGVIDRLKQIYNQPEKNM